MLFPAPRSHAAPRALALTRTPRTAYAGSLGLDLGFVAAGQGGAPAGWRVNGFSPGKLNRLPGVLVGDILHSVNSMQVLGNLNALDALAGTPRPMTLTFLRVGGGQQQQQQQQYMAPPAYAMPPPPMPAPPTTAPTNHTFTLAAPGSLGLQLNFAPGPIPGAPPVWSVTGFNPGTPCLVPGVCAGDVLYSVNGVVVVGNGQATAMLQLRPVTLTFARFASHHAAAAASGDPMPPGLAIRGMH